MKDKTNLFWILFGFVLSIFVWLILRTNYPDPENKKKENSSDYYWRRNKK